MPFIRHLSCHPFIPHFCLVSSSFIPHLCHFLSFHTCVLCLLSSPTCVLCCPLSFHTCVFLFHSTLVSCHPLLFHICFILCRALSFHEKHIHNYFAISMVSRISNNYFFFLNSIYVCTDRFVNSIFLCCP